MRTPFISQSRDLLLQLRSIQSRRTAASLQVASGIRVSKPSDSPSDAAGIVRTESDLARLNQFRDNLEASQAELRSVDGALSGAADAVNRALTLASQATSPSMDASTRAHIREELEGIFRGLLLIANTTHADRFLFAGNATDTRPFLADPSVPDGVQYLGSSDSRTLLFPDGETAQISLPGDAIFARPDRFEGSGRTPGVVGAAVPSPPAGIGIAFSGDIDGVISTDLDGFFVAPAPPTIPAGGETITVTFTTTDGSLTVPITTDPLVGGETTAGIALTLNPPSPRVPIWRAPSPSWTRAER